MLELLPPAVDAVAVLVWVLVDVPATTAEESVVGVAVVVVGAPREPKAAGLTRALAVPFAVLPRGVLGVAQGVTLPKLALPSLSALEDDATLNGGKAFPAAVTPGIAPLFVDRSRERPLEGTGDIGESRGSLMEGLLGGV
ncbi:MAG: hypothetical protein Q7T95_01435 [Hydrogenophaga sp.]|nr:hypothetical protein [Hydrogenophaga sp.]